MQKARKNQPCGDRRHAVPLYIAFRLLEVHGSGGVAPGDSLKRHDRRRRRRGVSLPAQALEDRLRNQDNVGTCSTVVNALGNFLSTLDLLTKV